MINDLLLTTIDNPFNPHTQWDDWYAFDTYAGYHTCNYLARICKTSTELSDNTNNEIIQSAMQEIIKFNLSGKYILVSKDNFDSEIAEGLKRLQ